MQPGPHRWIKLLDYRQRMELACEETFMHLISDQDAKGSTVMFKIVRVQQGLFTEAIIGGSVNDVVNLTPRTI